MAREDVSGSEPGVAPSPSSPQKDRNLGDLYRPMRMGRTEWLVLGMFLLGVVAFFIIVVCLGVDDD